MDMKISVGSLDIPLFDLKDEKPWLKAYGKIYLVFELPEFPIVTRNERYMPALWDTEYQDFTTLEGGGIDMPITHWSPII